MVAASARRGRGRGRAQLLRGGLMGPNVFVSRHPLVLHKLALLRSADAPPPLFRSFVRDCSRMLFLEAAHDLKTSPITVRTPLGDCPGHQVADRVALSPVLRPVLAIP